MPTLLGSNRPAIAPALWLFFRYYRDVQRVCSAAEWRECQALFMQPVSLSLRLNRCTARHRHAVEALRRAFGDRALSVPWMESSGGAVYVAPAASARAAEEGLDLVKAIANAGDAVLQESASMLPALALDPQPDEAVLDLCSAPGSKTCQLLDAMATAAHGTPQGLLIANELYQERAARVWNRARWQPSTALLVTAVDARDFPAVAGRGFDRILVDVPCSS